MSCRLRYQSDSNFPVFQLLLCNESRTPFFPPMSVQSTSRIIALEDGESEPLLPGLQDSTPPTPESFGGLKRQPTLNTPLLTLVLILLVVSAVMSGLFAASITRNQGGNRGGEETTVCLNSSCVLTAARILNSLDKSIDPCENFYNFASKLGSPGSD